MNKIGNFGFNALHSSLHTEGYFYDNHHDDGDFIKTIPAAKNWVLKRVECSTKSGSNNRFEFAFIPNNGFLNSPELLMKDCELKLSCDRAKAVIALPKVEESTPPDNKSILD